MNEKALVKQLRELADQIEGKEDKGEKKETTVASVDFEYVPNSGSGPYHIEKEDGWWYFDEDDLKEIVKFWRSCGANV